MVNLDEILENFGFYKLTNICGKRINSLIDSCSRILKLPEYFKYQKALLIVIKELFPDFVFEYFFKFLFLTTKKKEGLIKKLNNKIKEIDQLFTDISSSITLQEMLSRVIIGGLEKQKLTYMIEKIRGIDTTKMDKIYEKLQRNYKIKSTINEYIKLFDLNSESYENEEKLFKCIENALYPQIRNHYTREEFRSYLGKIKEISDFDQIDVEGIGVCNVATFLASKFLDNETVLWVANTCILPKISKVILANYNIQWAKEIWKK